MSAENAPNIKRIIKEFFITLFLLGMALVCAIFSTSLVQQDAEWATILAITSLILAFVGGLYIVPRLSKRINLRLFSWKFSYSVTSETAFFLTLATIVGFAAINTGNNLLYLVFSVLLAIILASGIISEASLRDVDISLRFSEHIFAEQETGLDLTLINNKHLLPSFSITAGIITDRVSTPTKLSSRLQQLILGAQAEKGFGKLAHYTVLPPRTRLSQKLIYTFPSRGSYNITGFSISTKFPFGFLRKTYEKAAVGEVIVYPNPKPINSFFGVVPMLAGWLESSQRGNSTDLYRLRQYVFSDNMRHIHWKATAKAHKLMVKEFTREDERRFTLVMDNSIDNEYKTSLTTDDAHFERAIELMASLADYFTKQGAELRLLTPIQHTEFGVGTEHLYKILRILALIEPVKVDAQTEKTASLEKLINSYDQDFKIVIASKDMVFPRNSNISVINWHNL